MSKATASIVVDDKFYLTAVLVAAAVSLTIAFLYWLSTYASWKWNNYIQSLAEKRVGPPIQEQEEEPQIQYPPQTATTTRRSTTTATKYGRGTPRK